MITLFENKMDCCGCNACMSICPQKAIMMVADKEGFLYPEIESKLCIECGMCYAVCPWQTACGNSLNFEQPETYALKHKSDEVRLNSSSGGAFTAISDYVLSINGVIYGVKFDEEFRVIHGRAETSEGKNKFRGSKYVQSDMKGVFKEIKNDLDNDRSVLFSGTGCQVAGLNNYLEVLKTDISKLITIDLICHGTPSPKIFADYIKYIEKKRKCKVVDYHFRSKVNGWGHTEELLFQNGKHDHKSIISQLHKELFYSDLTLRPACYQCKYTNFQRPADITIADYWGIEKYLPKFKDSLGVSAVIINTLKGKTVFSELEESVEIIPSNIYDCAKGQPHLYSPARLNSRRDQFWADYLKYGFEFIIKKYTNYGFKHSVKRMITYLLRKIKMINVAKKIIGSIKK